MNVMTLFEQTDRALTLYVNQFAGHSMVLDKFVYDILDTSLLNGGVFLAAYWWLWFEADESGVPAKRRNVVVALLAVIGVAGALKLLKVHLPFRYRPLNDPDLGLRLPFGVDPVSLNHFSSFPSGHAMLFFALSVPLWIRSRWLGAAAAGWTLLASVRHCFILETMGKRHLRRRCVWRGAHAPTVPALGCICAGPDHLLRPLHRAQRHWHAQHWQRRHGEQWDRPCWWLRRLQHRRRRYSDGERRRRHLDQ
jgi:hypothetical protein